MCRWSGEFVVGDRQACSAAVRFHSGDQLGCEVVERLVAGEQKHVCVGDCSAGGRVPIEIDHGKVNGDGQLTAAGDLENRKSYRFLVIHASREGWTCSIRQRIGTDGPGESTEIVVVDVTKASTSKRRNRGRYLYLTDTGRAFRLIGDRQPTGRTFHRSHFTLSLGLRIGKAGALSGRLISGLDGPA
jgi:hypothetical protein